MTQPEINSVILIAIKLLMSVFKFDLSCEINMVHKTLTAFFFFYP